MASAPITTTTEIEQPVNVAFQRVLLDNAKPLCPYFMGTSPAVIMRHQGTFTAYWRQFDNLTPTTSALSALTGNVAFPTRASVQPSTSNVTATLGKFGQYILVNEEVDLINFTEQQAKLVEILGISAGRSLNQLQRNEEEDNSTAVLANGATKVAAIADILLKADIKKVVNQLQRNSANKFTPMTAGSPNDNTSPVPRAFWGLCHPDVEEDIRGVDSFIPVEKYAQAVDVAPGEFGYAERVRFISSEDASIDTNSGTAATKATALRASATNVDVYNTVIYGMNAFGSLGLDTPHLRSIYRSGDRLPPIMLIAKPKGSSGAADPLDELATVGWKSWHAAAVLNTDWSRNLRTGATAL